MLSFYTHEPRIELPFPQNSRLCVLCIVSHQNYENAPLWTHTKTHISKQLYRCREIGRKRKKRNPSNRITIIEHIKIHVYKQQAQTQRLTLQQHPFLTDFIRNFSAIPLYCTYYANILTKARYTLTYKWHVRNQHYGNVLCNRQNRRQILLYSRTGPKRAKMRNDNDTQKLIPIRNGLKNGMHVETNIRMWYFQNKYRDGKQRKHINEKHQTKTATRRDE